MRHRLAAAWRVLRGKATVYRATLYLDGGLGADATLLTWYDAQVIGGPIPDAYRMLRSNDPTLTSPHQGSAT